MGFLGGHGVLTWLAFTVLVAVLVAIDLGLVNRRSGVIRFREALLLSVVWTVVGLAFGWVAAHLYGKQAGLEYIAGYVIERALSVDNLFVFLVIFNYFSVSNHDQRRVLYWGIVMALVMRAVLIITGAALVYMFHWVLYVFGAFLIYTGFHLLFGKDSAPEPDRNPLVRLAKKFFPVDATAKGSSFFVRRADGLHATPLFIVVIVVGTTDLVFALDSIPAIFGVTRDPFIILTSNVFAVLGLRALYFLIAALIPHFRFLKHGLSAVLVLVGLRMLTEKFVDIPTAVTLLAVCGILALSIVASLIVPKRGEKEP